MDRLITYACGRTQGFLDELGRLRDSEFPYEQGKDAVDLIAAVFKQRLANLKTLDAKTNPAVVKQQCWAALQALFEMMPLAGLLLRSTNVRNAFELFRPLLRLAQDALEPGVPAEKRQTRLVLSSEWDYSPMSYSAVPDLPGFVLIGLPAPESSNPLVVPLAGHELGHSVWRRRKLATHFHSVVKQHLLKVIEDRWTDYKSAFPGLTISKAAELQTDLFALETWQAAHRWALEQAEELYCDLFGLLVFGTSYLHAYAYLLAPKVGLRSPTYPSQLRRVRNLVTAAGALGIVAPSVQSHKWL